MISIVVSSYKKPHFEAFSENVAQTIGATPYEIVQIWNPGSMGICAAYNKGAKNAVYPYLCFVHEDVLFKTKNWGDSVLQHLQNFHTGAIGVAGTAYKSEIPSSWSIFKQYNAIHIFQHFKENRKTPQLIKQPMDLSKSQVVALDGVFIATRKAVWEQFPFDAETFTHFHGYDIDFSLALSKNFKLYVVSDILLEHLSQGNADREWLSAAMKISQKWKNILPVSCVPINNVEEKELRTEAKRRLIKKLNRLNYNWYQKIYYTLKYT